MNKVTKTTEARKAKKTAETRRAKKTAEKQKQLNPPPSIFNMDDIREARRDKAFLILDERLPALVIRLRALQRRSKAAADERGCLSSDQLQWTTDGGAPYMEAKKRSLPNQLNELMESANALLEEHLELLKEGNERAFAKKKKSNWKLWKDLSDKATELVDTHVKIRHSVQPDEEYGLRKQLEDAQMILRHPVFELLQSDEEPMQQEQEMEEEEAGEEEDSADSSDSISEPLDDTADLIELVTGEMRKIIEGCLDLNHWLTLSSPPLDIITEYESFVRDKIVDLINDLVDVCEDGLKYPEEFLKKRTELLMKLLESPLSLDRMRAMDAFNSTKAIEWRRHISRLVLQCLEVMDFTVKHRDMLDQFKSRPLNNDTAHIYS